MYIAHTRHPAYYNRPATSNEAQDISEFSPAHPHRQSVQAHPRSSLVTPSPSLQLHLCSTLYTAYPEFSKELTSARAEHRPASKSRDASHS